VFEAMFNSGMLEPPQNVVQIADFPDEIVQGMLNFIYTGHSDSLQENAVDLLQIADKYELLDLKKMCEKWIGNNLNVKEAAEILVVTNLHSPTTLKPKVVSFINQ
jgi:hypothetical protein